MLLVFVGALVALWLASRQVLSLDWLIAEEMRLRGALAEAPVLGFVAGFIVYVGVSLVPGTTGKAILAGWFYGFWPALVLVNVGLTVAALISFFVSRYVCLETIQNRFGPRLERVNRALDREGAGYLFCARVLHVPYCLTNYVMGATPLPWRGFWWATQLGMLPGNVVFVYAGARLPTLEVLAEEGPSALFTPALFVAFVALSILPIVARWAVRRLAPSARRGDDDR
jgi:uncharacterized membrane protein YdjX (TVP38/TMEM64 family)